jgi:AcrR family transcriptional regulator
MTDREPLGPDAWIAAALSALRDGGITAVAVERLAESLGVTKGSFYWHFPNRDALLAAALDSWEERETESMVRKADQVSEPRERLRSLIRQAYRSAAARKLARTLSALAAHPVVGPRVRRVAMRRLGYLRSCFEAIGLDERSAQSAARLIYAAYLGLAELEALSVGPGSKAESEEYVEQLIAWVLAAEERKTADEVPGRASRRLT